MLTDWLLSLTYESHVPLTRVRSTYLRRTVIDHGALDYPFGPCRTGSCYVQSRCDYPAQRLLAADQLEPAAANTATWRFDGPRSRLKERLLGWFYAGTTLPQRVNPLGQTV
ncbi:MAG: hypothetical protein JWM13_177 [Arthrobacter sp.]|nr:hypothetical protein [Arthrobacter sp.]